MSRDIDELRQRFFGRRQAAGDGTVFQAVVTKVDEKEFTCTVCVDDEIEYSDVRLRSIIKAGMDGFAFIPKLESVVLVCRIDSSNELFVCQFSEIDKVIFSSGDGKKIKFVSNLDRTEIKWGDKVSLVLDDQMISLTNDQSTVEISGDTVTINSGDLGGLVKIGELKENLASLKKFVESMHSALPPAFASIGDGSAAKGGNGGNSYSATMAGKTIQIKDMENKKVKQ